MLCYIIHDILYIKYHYIIYTWNSKQPELNGWKWKPKTTKIQKPTVPKFG